MAVIVLGMHRGGTSATTRLVNLLGVPLGDVDDRMQPHEENPRGYWESATLTAFNDELLETLGGHWTAPAAFPGGREAELRLGGHRERAVEALRAVYSTSRWVWKDPRLCITLPFWLTVFERPPVFVLPLRNPLEIAASLAARRGFSRLYSLALWERYVRSALENADGHAAFVVRFVDLLHDRPRCMQELQEFLVRHDAIEGPAAPEAVIAAEVDAKLRHHVRAPSAMHEERGASQQQKDLHEILERLCGTHERLSVRELPEETPWAAELIEERRERWQRERREAAAAENDRRRIESLERDLSRSAEQLGRLSTLLRARDDLIRAQESRLDRFRLSWGGRLLRWLVPPPLRRRNDVG